MNERITLSFEKGFATALRERAKATGRTMSGLARVAISHYMEVEVHD